MANTVLVVDDEKEIRTLLKQVFENEGYDVRTVDSAENALKLLEQEKIHVIFLDLNLPEMNGIKLCSIIRKNMPMAIIHAITGYASLFELSDCRDAGFDDYFIKPMSLKILKQVTRDAFLKIDRWKNRGQTLV